MQVPPRHFSHRLSLILGSILATGSALFGLLYSPLPYSHMGMAVCTLFALIYIGLLMRWSAGWLILLPALLPVIDQVKTTGNIFLTESDLLMLFTLAVVYFKQGFGSSNPADETHLDTTPQGRTNQGRRSGKSSGKSTVPLRFYLLTGLFLLSTLISTLLVIPSSDPLHSQWSEYHSIWNSLRVAKGFLLPLFFIPLIVAEYKVNAARTLRWFGYGLILGLAMVCAYAIAERLSYVSLADFASDYRITASFWEMNVGGAAIDGFLMLTLPFAAWLALTPPGNAVTQESTGTSRPKLSFRMAAGLVLLLLASYTVLATFTRTTYVASAVVFVILAVALTRRRLRLAGQRIPAHHWLIGALLLATLVYAMHSVFQHGGYRTLAALITVLVASHYMVALKPTPHAAASPLQRMFITAALALGVALLSLLADHFHFKGSYLAFASITFGLIALAWRQSEHRQRSNQALLPAVITALWLDLLLAGGLIARHWGDRAALIDYAVVAFCIVAVVFILKRRSFATATAPWRWSPLSSACVLIVSLMLGLVVAVMANYQMGERFSQVEQNWTERKQHWATGLNLLNSPQDWLLGLGTGSFPYQYWQHATDRLVPGTIGFEREPGQPYVHLTSNHTDMGFYEMLRLLQQVPVHEISQPLVMFRVRAPQDVKLNFEICARHLIYADECLAKEFIVSAKDGQWQDLTLKLDRGQLRPGPWYRPKDYYFALAIGSTAKTADITDLQLIGNSGTNLLRNSNFQSGSDHWFSTSDRNHLPWHAKNLFLHLLIEQGLFGLAAFSALLLAVVVRTYKYRRSWDEAPYYLASIVGFVITGLFDSLLDVPRVAMLFYLLCWMILLRPASLRPTSQGQT